MSKNTYNIKCWELEETSCHSETLCVLMKQGRPKKDICTLCTYHNLVIIGFLDQPRFSKKTAPLSHQN